MCDGVTTVDRRSAGARDVADSGECSDCGKVAAATGCAEGGGDSRAISSHSAGPILLVHVFRLPPGGRSAPPNVTTDA